MAVAQSVRDNEREVSIILTSYQEKEQCQREREAGKMLFMASLMVGDKQGNCVP